MENYNYRQALDYLDAIDEEKVDRLSLQKLHARAQLVGGDIDTGMKEIRSIESSIYQNGGTKTETARILFKAAEVLIREKDRVGTAIALFDSTIKRDPGLQDEVLKVAWNRGVEYINVTGTAGYRLFNFQLKYDEKVIGRLRGFNRAFASRYDEIRNVKRQLAKIDRIIDKFQSENKRNPESLMELTEYYPPMQLDTVRKGWTFHIDKVDDYLMAAAEALEKNPAGVIDGTTVYAPENM